VSEPIAVPQGSTIIIGERWPGPGPVVVLLHAGVADRRSWYAVAEQLSEHATVIAYDRRGFGETRPGTDPFSHLDDLIALLDHLEVNEAWLVGSSAGGKLAIDVALVAPGRVAGLVLIAPGVSGAPSPDEGSLEPQLVWLDQRIDEQLNLGNLDDANRLETWLWLDGPAGPEGRVSGAVRELALDMNRVILANGIAETPVHIVNAWDRLEELAVATVVVWGSLDVGFLIAYSQALVSRISSAQYHCLAGLAHLPYLEDPSAIAEIVIDALTEEAHTVQP